LRTVPPARTEAPAGCGAPHRIPAIIIGRYARGRLRSTSCWWSHNAQLCSPERIGGAPPALRTRAPETNRCASAACPRETRRSFSAFAHGALLQFSDTRRAPSNRETRLRKIAPVRGFLRKAHPPRSTGAPVLRVRPALRRYESGKQSAGSRPPKPPEVRATGAWLGVDGLSRSVSNRSTRQRHWHSPVSRSAALRTRQVVRRKSAPKPKRYARSSMAGR